jgi:hypothetical protein
MEAGSKTTVPTALLIAFLVCGGLLIFGCVLTPYFTARPGPDQSSYLFEAGRVLSGIEPYGPHLTEVSPPLIIWFSMLPVLLAQLSHGTPILFLRLLMTLMIVGSVAWCLRILLRGTLINRFSIGLLISAIVAIEFCIGPHNFGQREHILLVLLLPYILAVGTGAVYRFSVIERGALGAAAGVAIWLKPQYTLALVGLELFIALRTRGVRRLLAPEFLALVLASSLLLIVVLLAAPLYVKVTLPLLVDTYWALGTMDTLPLALHRSGSLLLILAMLIACFVFRRSLRDWATPANLLVCSLALFAAFAIQHNDWWYHAYPYMALLLLAAAYLLTNLLYPAIIKVSSDRGLLRRALVAASAVMVVLLCVVAANLHVVLTAGTHLESDPLDQFLAQYEASTTVYVFSTNEAALSFSYNNGLNWGSRFAHLWMLPGIIQNETGPIGPPAPFKRLSLERVTSLADLLRGESAEDLRYWRPSVVIVEGCHLNHFCQGMGGKDFNMLAWFLQGPEFAAAWSHYQKQTAFDNDNYDVYRLVP